MQNMPTYSLYYFSKATALRPFDPRFEPHSTTSTSLLVPTDRCVAHRSVWCGGVSRMWCALGEAYERLNKTDSAVQCYERAEANGDREGIALNKLAKLYERKNEQRLVRTAFCSLRCRSLHNPSHCLLSLLGMYCRRPNIMRRCWSAQSRCVWRAAHPLQPVLCCRRTKSKRFCTSANSTNLWAITRAWRSSATNCWTAALRPPQRRPSRCCTICA
jgi:hypothetical protein